MASSAETPHVLIPIRTFHGAKSRLSPVLDEETRAELSRAMAARVIAAAHHLPVHVVTDEREVAVWADERGAAVIEPGVSGLTASVTVAIDQLRGQGVTRAIIAHADLPAARDLRIVDRRGVGIAPDRVLDGSNVLSIPTDAGFALTYGVGSFARHCSEAHRLGLPLTIVQHPELAWDVDDPADLPPEWKDR